MLKTTIYLPERLKRRLRRAASREGASEAALIRRAIERLVDDVAAAPKPRLPLFESGDPRLAERVDEALAAGFGRR